MKTPPISSRAVGIWKQSVSESTRVLITGSSGWFGRTAIAMCLELGQEFQAQSLSGIPFEVNGKTIFPVCHSLSAAREFDPEIVIDCAFATREKVNLLGSQRHLQTNREILSETLKLIHLPNLKGYLGFSSGAIENLTGRLEEDAESHPYELAKKEFENQISHSHSSSSAILNVARVWSVSGNLATKPDLFAFTDFIDQALKGHVEVRNREGGLRRYCSIEEVLAIGLARIARGDNGIYNTGGEKIDLRELAELVCKILNPKAQISFGDETNSRGANNYLSDGLDWKRELDHFNLEEESIVNQIKRVSSTFN